MQTTTPPWWPPRRRSGRKRCWRNGTCHIVVKKEINLTLLRSSPEKNLFLIPVSVHILLLVTLWLMLSKWWWFLFRWKQLWAVLGWVLQDGLWGCYRWPPLQVSLQASHCQWLWTYCWWGEFTKQLKLGFFRLYFNWCRWLINTLYTRGAISFQSRGHTQHNFIMRTQNTSLPFNTSKRLIQFLNELVGIPELYTVVIYWMLLWFFDLDDWEHSPTYSVKRLQIKINGRFDII